MYPFINLMSDVSPYKSNDNYSKENVVKDNSKVQGKIQDFWKLGGGGEGLGKYQAQNGAHNVFPIFMKFRGPRKSGERVGGL